MPGGDRMGSGSSSSGSTSSGSGAPAMPDNSSGGKVTDKIQANAVNYVSEVSYATNLTVVGEMIGVGILLTLVSSLAAVLFIMRYEPLKILSNRD